MTRKFGSYRIDYKKISLKHNRKEGTDTAIVRLSGTIEIGIDIDTMTWRADWLLDKLYGDKASNYDIISVDNNYLSRGMNEVNEVTAVIRNREANRWNW